MYETTINNPIYLVHKDDGVIRTFKSWDNLVNNWFSINNYDIGPGPSHKRVWSKREWIREERRLPLGVWPSYHYAYILRDSYGDTIDPEDVKNAYRKKHPRKWGWLSHGWRRGAYGGYRCPKTTHEFRWATAWDDEEFAPKAGFARSSRIGRNLPNAWDDYLAHSDKSWKTQSKRKHQWRPK